MECLGITTLPDGEWFCSPECRESDGSGFCICRKKKAEDLLDCAAGEKCDNNGKFHKTCVGIVPQLGDRESK
jgi:hypothetical protein